MDYFKVNKTMDQKWESCTVDRCYAPPTVDTRRSVQDGRSFPSIILKKHHLSKSELVGIGVRLVSHDGEGFPSAIATGPKKHHKSELVVGIGTQSNSAQQHNYNLVNSIKTDIKEFASIFTKPHSTQPPYTGVTLQHYPSFNGI